MKSIQQLFLLFLALFTWACNQSDHKAQEHDVAFTKYIAAYSSNIISVKDEIIIKLQVPSTSFTEAGASIGDNIIKTKPAVQGQTYWINNKTLAFKPDKGFQPGTAYSVSFSLGELLNVPSPLQTFNFGVMTKKQAINLVVDGVSPYTDDELKWNSLTATLYSYDFMEAKEVSQLIEVSVSDRLLPIQWNHDATGTEHTLRVDSIERKDARQEINIKLISNEYSLKQGKNVKLTLPGLKEFAVMDIIVVQEPEQHITIKFSDALKTDQDLTGLVHLEDYDDFNFVIRKNELTAYPRKRISDLQKLTLEKAIVNAMGSPMEERFQTEISFTELKPEIAFSHSGVIFPHTGKVVFPFRAVNLKAVDLTVTKIYENNIQQFLQNNDLSGSYQLNRVGKVLLRRRIALDCDSESERSEWRNYAVDLSDLVALEPGAVYRLAFAIRKEYSSYSCDGSVNNEEQILSADLSSEIENYNNWQYYDDYFGYSYSYQWRERDDPCSPSYFNRQRFIATNLLASNMGILAKAEKTNQLFVSVSDLKSTEPIHTAELLVYDYQNQKIAEAKTDKDGNAWLQCSSKPFLIVASYKNEKAYLKLQDGNALSTSHFNVNGDVVQDGLKGFIYGDRGVWRPGDTLHLSFILEDEMRTLPEDYPVTLELYDPKGQLHLKTLNTGKSEDLYVFSIPTSHNALTGSWSAQIKIGAAYFSKRIRIETIKPNRLKIDLQTGVDEISSDHEKHQLGLNAQWLHGAKAKNLRAQISLTLAPSSTSFKSYEEYSFVDYTKSYDADEQIVFDGKLDDQGHADIPLQIKLGELPPGKLNAHFTTRVFEAGGDFSIDHIKKRFSPFKRYVGIKLEDGLPHNTYSTDSINYFEVVTVNEQGQLIDVENLEVEIFKTEWRWWWDSSNDYNGNYVGNRYSDMVHKAKVSTKNGKARVEFQINYPEWGRFVIRVRDKKGMHSATKFMYVDWPSWRSQDNDLKKEAASILSLESDKSNYVVGDKARIVIPASGTGRALVTIEDGTQVLKAEWLEIKNKEKQYDFEVTKDMAPNVYVNVTVIQEYDHDNNLPLRLYGIVPIDVENPQTVLSPKLQMPDELKPESQVKLKISEENGRPMSYTIAVVDEGILDLTRFKTPSPHNAFYAKEALGVKSWDVYDDVIGAYGAELERILSIGGDAEETGKAQGKINRFKPMVRFLGPFTLKARDKNTHLVDIPNYIGSVRTMVIAGKDMAYGSTEKTVPVKKDLMVLGTVPRVLGPSEKIKVPVTVFAMDDKIKNVKVELHTNKGFTSDVVQSKTIRFDQAGEKILYFDLEVADKTGKGEVRIEVSGHGEKASYEVELEVRNPNSKISRTENFVILPGESWNHDYTTFGLPGTNEMLIELTNTQPVDFEKRLKQLIRYPHGCTEQTTSQAFPQLFLKDIMNEDPNLFAYASKNVIAAIARLESRQNNDGSFRMWPSYSDSDDWVSSYVGHFLLEAEAKGFRISSRHKQNWLSFQKKTSRAYRRFTDPRDESLNQARDFAQAYRLFTLALAGEPDIGSMNRLKAENNLTDPGIWRLAAAYHLAGQKDVASEMVFHLKTRVSEGDYDYNYRSYIYGSSTRDDAMILESMALMEMHEESAESLKHLSNRLSENRWMNTQTTAFALLAYAKCIISMGQSDVMEYSYTVNTNEKTDHRTMVAINRLEVPVSQTPSGNLKLENTGEAMIYGRLISSGTPLYGQEEADAKNIEIQLQYTNMDGQKIDVATIEQGTDILAQVTITNKLNRRGVKNLALSQIFPSAWEIQNFRLTEAPNVYGNSRFEYQNIRDDRVYTYFDLGAPNSTTASKSYTVLLNASYLGSYYLPGVKLEAMYDGDIYANTKGQWISVVKPGSTE